MLLEGGSSVVPVVVAMALAAQAPPGEPPESADTIIVTGERAKRSLKDTAASVAVFTKRDSDRRPAPDRGNQLLHSAPNARKASSRDTPSVRGQDSIGVLQGLPGFLGGARLR